MHDVIAHIILEKYSARLKKTLWTSFICHFIFLYLLQHFCFALHIWIFKFLCWRFFSYWVHSWQFMIWFCLVIIIIYLYLSVVQGIVIYLINLWLNEFGWFFYLFETIIWLYRWLIFIVIVIVMAEKNGCWDKMTAILHTIFSNKFFWIKIAEFWLSQH